MHLPHNLRSRAFLSVPNRCPIFTFAGLKIRHCRAACLSVSVCVSLSLSVCVCVCVCGQSAVSTWRPSARQQVIVTNTVEKKTVSAKVLRKKSLAKAAALPRGFLKGEHFDNVAQSCTRRHLKHSRLCDQCVTIWTHNKLRKEAAMSTVETQRQVGFLQHLSLILEEF